VTRDPTLAGYAVIAVAVVVCQWNFGRRGRTTLGGLVAWLTTRPATRWPLLAAWLWLGWHLFARADR